MQRYLPARLRRRRASATYFRVDYASAMRRTATTATRPVEIADFQRDRNRIDRDRLYHFLLLRYRFLCRRSAEFDSGPKLPVTRYATVSRRPTNFPVFLRRSPTIRFAGLSSESIPGNESFLRGEEGPFVSSHHRDAGMRINGWFRGVDEKLLWLSQKVFFVLFFFFF